MKQLFYASLLSTCAILVATPPSCGATPLVAGQVRTFDVANPNATDPGVTLAFDVPNPVPTLPGVPLVFDVPNPVPTLPGVPL